jgi:hypothetical protein
MQTLFSVEWKDDIMHNINAGLHSKRKKEVVEALSVAFPNSF